MKKKDNSTTEDSVDTFQFFCISNFM